MKSHRCILGTGLVALVLATTPIVNAQTMSFELGTPGGVPNGGEYVEAGMKVTSFSDNSQIGDPLLIGTSGNWFYFHGREQYVEFRRVDGALFDLTSFDLASNGYADRWLETSAAAARITLPTNHAAQLQQSHFPFVGFDYEDLEWFRVGTPWFATQVDNVSVVLASGDPPLYTPCDGVLFPGLLVPVGINPSSVAHGDLDGDGDQDLAVANISSNTVSVLLNQGSGTFAAQIQYATGATPWSVAIGDLDGDGDQDLAVANINSNTVSVLLNQGSGTFAAHIQYVTGANPNSVAIGDLDGDGDQDLAVANRFGDSVSVLLNQGSGTFASQSPYATGVRPYSVAIGDLDGDGDQDLAVANRASSGTVSVLLNQGSGTFAAHVQYATGTDPVSVAIGDLDGDGDRDLAVANLESSGTVSVLLNQGSGTFAPRVAYAAGPNARSVAIGDLDGDGDRDLAVANFVSSGTVSVLLNQGSGTFGAQTQFATGASAVSVAMADLDGDGEQDLAVGNYDSASVTVLVNRGSGTFATQTQYATGASPYSLAIGDLDGDGDQDLAAANLDSNSVSVIFNQGSGTFALQTQYATGISPSSVAIGDLDGDGDLDLAVANYQSNYMSVLLNQGSGTFSPQTTYATGGFQYSVAIGDLDADGDQDLAISKRLGNTVSVLLNQGTGTFAPHVPYATGLLPAFVTTGDLDGDGDRDLAVANWDGNTVSVLLNEGSGTLAPQTQYATGTRPNSLAIADFDGDGDQDLAVANNSSNSVSVLRNQGSGTFAPQSQYPTGAGSYSVAMGDLDGDGDPDLTIANRTISTVSVLLNQGDGTFTSQTQFATGTSPVSVAIEDLDGDGDRDVAVANWASSTVSVLIAECSGTLPFPSGPASFADAVIDYDPAFSGGAIPAAPYNDPNAALGVFDGTGLASDKSCSLGAGGRLDLQFIDNRLANNGTNGPDLVVFTEGDPVERATVHARPSTARTLERLTALGVSPDVDGYVALGQTSLGQAKIDLDALYPGTAIGVLHFDAVRLTDVLADGAITGPSVGADIDAVGAATSAAPAPDLAVKTLVVPSQGLASQGFAISWTVKNQGDTGTSGTWIDKVFLSADAFLGGDVQLGAFAAPADLAPGTSYTRSTSLVWPSSLGTRYVLVHTDSQNTIGEEVLESNNVTASTAIQIDPLPTPDLVALVLSVPGASVVSGSQISVTWRVTNQGPVGTSVPNWSDSFYLSTSNATIAGATNLGARPNLLALPNSASYDNVATLTLPHDIAGSFYIAVKTDSGNAQPELNEANNIAFSATPITVELEPQPDLQVIDIDAGVPPIIAFSGNYLSVSWKDKNFGTGVSNANSWTDAVYLSADVNASISVGDLLIATKTQSAGFLAPGAHDVRSVNALVPANLEGNFFVKVQTDTSNVVSEFGGGFESNNVSAGAEPVTLVLSVTPDLHALSIGPAGSSSVLAGHSITVDWSVVDDGFADWDSGFSWSDSVYLSSNATYEAGTDVLLGTFGQSATYDGSQWLGTSYSRSAALTIPQGTVAGAWFLLVRVDSGNSVFEYLSDGGQPPANIGEANNFAASLPILVDVQATDLAITAGLAGSPPPTSGAGGETLALAWQVTNQGTAVTPVSSFRDSIYLSSDAVFQGGVDTHVASVTHSGALAASARYTVSTSGAVPYVAPGPRFLLFVTDSANQVWELGGEANNVVATPFTIAPQWADLQVTSLLAPSATSAGEPIVITWTVSNTGTLETSSTTWIDRVWLSADESLGGGDILLGTRTHSGRLAASGSYTDTGAFELPITISGLWYLAVETDAATSVLESNESNNQRYTRTQIDIASAQPANLVVTAVSAPVSVLSGQPIAIEWTVANVGSGGTSTGAWTDAIYLSPDTTLDTAADRLLSGFGQSGFLDASESRTQNESFVVPLGVSGSYHVLVKTNSNAAVYEAGQDSDNDAATATPTAILLPPASNLRITDIQVPATANLGSSISVTWTTTNDAGSAVVGTWSDVFFLSADDELDASDLPMRSIPSTAGTVAVGALHVQTDVLTVPGALPGAYRVLARCDGLDQILETDEEDNLTASLAQVNLTAIPIVPALAPGVVSTVALVNGGEAYWQLTAPAGLTVRLDLDHQTSAAWTELYVRESAIPAPGVADWTFENPGASTQSLVIPLTNGNPFFILARATSGVGARNQDATLTATILPFQVTSVVPPVVGNELVSFELRGSQLQTLASVVLRQSGGGQQFVANEFAVIDASRAIAAFRWPALAPLGSYDIEVTSTLSEVSTLLNGLIVEEQGNDQAAITLELPASVKKGKSGSAVLRVRNTGNGNIQHMAVAVTTDAGQEAIVSSSQTGLQGLESDGVRDSVLFWIDDLGPSQEATVALEFSIGSQFEADELAFRFYGRTFPGSAYPENVTNVVAELLRLEVLADPASNAGLLALANSTDDWSDAVVDGLPEDSTDIRLPGTVPATGRDVVGVIAQVAASGLSAVDQVPASSIAVVSGGLHCSIFGGAFDVAGVPLECFELPSALPGAGQSTATVNLVFGTNYPLAEAATQTPTSDDPNEKTGPSGFGQQNAVSGSSEFPYRIYFENQASAAAPASFVRISDVLEPVLRASRFRLRAIRFGDTEIVMPPNTISFQQTLDLSQTLGVLVRINAGINASTNEAFWTFQSLDPVTGQPFADGVNGFLPPEDGSGRGGGQLDFSVGPGTGAITGGVVRNSAHITFDQNLALKTNEVQSTFDSDLPFSGLLAAPHGSTGFALNLSWSGDDPVGGTGVKDFTVYVSRNNGPYVPLVTDTLTSSMLFEAEPASTYRFYSRSRDNTGNREPVPSVPDATFAAPPDCNDNHVADTLDIANATSADCDANLVPDDCQSDADGDSTIDACDGCPSDPLKTAPGTCGCGVPDSVADGDRDGLVDCIDNCDAIANPGQEDCDRDGVGDVCELAGTSTDVNANGIPDECDGAVIAYCFGDGSATACPCGNASALGLGSGCLNSTGFGALLSVSGNVGQRSVLLNGSGLPGTALCTLLTSVSSATPGVVFGDGVSCLGASPFAIPAQVKQASGGLISFDPRDLPPGQRRFYQIAYRDSAPSFCTSATVNRSNAVRIAW